jgi:hypothetical protein
MTTKMRERKIYIVNARFHSAPNLRPKHCPLFFGIDIAHKTRWQNEYKLLIKSTCMNKKRI